MVYTWGENEFVNEIKKLHSLTEGEKDLKRRLYLERVCDAIDKIYHETFNFFTPPSISAKQRISNITSSRLEFGRYYSLIGTFFEECSEHLELADSISDKLEKISQNGNFDFLQTNTIISHEHTLSLAKQFFHELDTDIHHAFSQVYDDRFGTLRFVDEATIKNSNSNGNTIFLDGVNKNFITIAETSPIDTFACVIHEYGHAIHNIFNPSVLYSERNDFFLEVSSIFLELISLYENNRNFSDLEIAYYFYSTYATYIEYAEFLTLHTPLLNEWASFKYKMTKKFFDSLEETYDIDEECFEKCLSTTIESEGTYVMSFVVAIELFHIYKKDKNKALKLFKGFLCFPANEDILVYIMENFELSKHASNEIKVVFEDFDKKLTKRMF